MLSEAVRSTLARHKPAAPTTPKMPPAPVSAPVAALSPVPPAAPAPTPARAVPREKFWFNWSPTELCPKRRYSTVESARAEAVRLRSIAPQKEFLTYEAKLVADGQAS